MFDVHRIDSLDRPELEPFRTMHWQVAHREQGIFVAESDKVVARLLESHFTVFSLVLPEKWLARFESLLALRPERVQVYLLEKKELERLTGFTFYQGVLALARVPRAPSLDELLRQSPKPWLLAAVEGVTSAENLGGLVRNCAAFGVHGVLVDRTSASPYLRRAVRSSMGTIFRVPALERLELTDSIRQLQVHGIHCLAAHPHAQGRLLSQAELSKDCCIVFGSEGYGISAPLLAACDAAAAIPMVPGVDSLNVGSAAAVFLYEAQRQRR